MNYLKYIVQEILYKSNYVSHNCNIWYVFKKLYDNIY